MESLAYSVTLTTINCGCCGGVYAINEQYRAKCNQDGTGWHCPYCQVSWGYFSDNENAQLRRQLEAAKREAERERKRKEWAEQEARHAELRARAQKGVATRIKNRVSKGVCPCCNRTFSDLARHMETKHPDYATKETA